MGNLGRTVSAIALAAGIAFAGIAAAGCSKVENAAGIRGGAVIPGVLRIVGVGSIDSLLPELSGNASASDIAMFWGAWLYRADDRGRLIPELATNVPTLANGGISRDGLTITYHLRAGVKWHDGARFSANDVVFTWRAIMNDRNNVSTRTGYDQIASMTALNATTVQVKLKQPYAPAVATFFGPSLAPMCILPEHILGRLPDINRAAYDSKPIGTGPFFVDRYEPGNRIVLKANPRYWRGPPKLKEVDFLVVPDTNTRVVMMQTGEADLYYQAANTAIPGLRAVGGIRIVDAPFNEFWYLTFNEGHQPLDDVRVRRAVAMGIDREKIVRVIAHGLGTPAQGDQPEYSWAYDPHVRAPQFDPSRAAQLLDEAGWRVEGDGYRHKNGKRLVLGYVTSQGYGEAKMYAPLFQEAMKSIGIDASVKTYPTSLLYATKPGGGILANGQFDVAWTGWIGGLDPDDATIWTCDQIPPNGYNFSFGCDPRIDAQERLALGSYNESVRRAAYWRVQELLAEDVPVDFLYWTHANGALRAGFEGFRPAPAASQFWNTWEWQT